MTFRSGGVTAFRDVCLCETDPMSDGVEQVPNERQQPSSPDAEGSAHPLGHITVGYDGSDASKEAVLWSIGAATRHDGSVRVISAWKSDNDRRGPSWVPHREPSAEERAQALDDGQRALDIWIESLDPTIPVTASATLCEGPVADVLIESAPGGVLALGNRQRSRLVSYAVGSVAHSVMSRPTGVTVLVPQARHRLGVAAPSDVIVGVDGSDVSVKALRWAVDAFAESGAAIIAVACAAPDASPTGMLISPWTLTPDEMLERADHVVMDAARNALDQRPPGASQVSIETRAVVAHAEEALAEASNTSALIVLGATGASGIRDRILGSTAARTIQRSVCPVAIVHG